jgi:hypothetical protein
MYRVQVLHIQIWGLVVVLLVMLLLLVILDMVVALEERQTMSVVRRYTAVAAALVLIMEAVFTAQELLNMEVMAVQVTMLVLFQRVEVLLEQPVFRVLALLDAAQSQEVYLDSTFNKRWHCC